MIQQEKPQLVGNMPVVWPTILDLGRDECKRILRKLELEAYAGVVSALRAQGDLTRDKKDLLGELTKVLSISTERHRAEVRRAVNDERLTTIAYHMSGPNSSSEWSVEGRRLVPLMPRLVPQTAFTVTANSVASATAHHNASLLLPAETGNKEVVVCYSYTSPSTTATNVLAPSASGAPTVKSPRPASPASNVVVLPSGSTVYVKSVSCADEDEKPRKRRRTNSSGSAPVMLKEVPKGHSPISKTITLPVTGGSPKMSNIMQSIANSLPSHISPVKITFTKPTTPTTNTTTQKVIIVTTSQSSSFVPNILSKSHNYAAMSKLVSSSSLSSPSHKQTVVIPASCTAAPTPSTGAVTTVVSSNSSAVMSTVAQGTTSSAVKVSTARLPSPKTLVGTPHVLAQFPKAQQLTKQIPQAGPGATTLGPAQATSTSPINKPTIQIKQESGVKIITQQMQPSKILPKPSSAALPSGTGNPSPIMVVSSNGAIMTSKLVSTSTGTQATYSRPTAGPSPGRMTSSPAGATYVKTTSGSIITVVPKSLATLGSKIISSNIVSGTTTKITTIPMSSKPNVIVVQKTTGKGTTIQGLPGKNVVTTLLNAGGEKALQTVPGAKPAIITASRPITKMIVTQPKALGAAMQPTTTTKIIPTKIVYGQQGKTQVLIKPKPMTFQTAVVSEHARQLVTESLQHVTKPSELALGVGPGGVVGQEGGAKEDSPTFTESSPSSSSESIHSTQDGQSVVRVIASRGQEWAEQEADSSPTLVYQEVLGEAQAAPSTIKALLELQQAAGKFPSTSASSGGLGNEADASSQPQKQQQQQAEVLSLFSSQASTLGKASPTSTTQAGALLVQQSEASLQGEEAVMEEGELEGDTLDPQTGLFYRSTQPTTQPPPPPRPIAAATTTTAHTSPSPAVALNPEASKPKLHLAPALPSKAPAPTSTSQPGLTSPPNPLKRAAPPLELAPSKEKASSSSSSSLSSSSSAAGPASGTHPVVVLSMKPPTTPQLPRLQQAPTSINRTNLHSPLSQPPPLQAHHPVGAEKASATQSQQQPIITQGATVTKITFGSHTSTPKGSGGSSMEAKGSLVAESSSSLGHTGDKSSVSDILKISMMEAEIDPSTEPMVVDSSSDCDTFSKEPTASGSGAVGTSSLISSSSSSGGGGGGGGAGSAGATTLLHHTKGPHTKFSHMPGLAAQKSKELDVIQVIPQYSIMPDSSQSNVVVEQSGFLEITDYTSQRLDDVSIMDQEVDSSNDEATVASPSEACAADQSQ